MDVKMDKMNPAMEKSYDTAKKTAENSEDIKIYSHNDCDGICAGSILSTVLDRLGKDHEKEFIPLNKLENIEIEHELTIFSDLGSGQEVDKLAPKTSKIIILDHHPPIRDLNYKHTVSYDFNEINPLHYGIDGSHYVSGGGLSYFLAKKFGYTDLSWIGVLSAVGDMQNMRTGKLEGLNKIILQDSIDEGQIKVTNDLSFYGRQTRPIFVALSYFGDIKLPITNSTKETIALMKELGIERKNSNDKFRTLSDLTNDEKQKLFRELIKMLSKEVPGKYIKHIPKLVVADSYEFLNEEAGQFLRDASEFSTGINACSRNNREDIALEVLKGDRCQSLEDMKKVLKDHRTYLAQTISLFEKDYHIIEDKNIQYFDGSGIKSNLVGTIAGMVLSQGNWQKPMVGFTQVGENNPDLKISLRCSRLLAYDGIHYGNIIRDVAKSVGGNGGGHSVACGAYIPPDKKEEFFKKFNYTLDGLTSINESSVTEIKEKVKKAGKYVENEKKREEEIKIKNEVESLINESKDILKDFKDEIPQNDKLEIKKGIGSLNDALKLLNEIKRSQKIERNQEIERKISNNYNKSIIKKDKLLDCEDNIYCIGEYIAKRHGIPDKFSSYILELKNDSLKAENYFTDKLINIFNITNNNSYVLSCIPGSKAYNPNITPAMVKVTKRVIKELNDINNSNSFIDGTQCLYRYKDIKPSKLSTMEERRDINRHLKSIEVKDKDVIKNKAVILLDDVVTSKTTMRACMKLLYDAGASNIIGIGLGKTHWR
jgi:RecJ-like exonuclease